jgi:hypothetical protein
MKNFCVRSLLVFACLIAATPLALRAATGIKVVFNAPFSFVVGTTTLPAGSYQVTEEDNRLLIIQGVGQPNAAAAVVYAIRSGETPEKSKLGFERHGQSYYLNTVQLGDGRTVRLLGQDAEKSLNGQGVMPAARKSASLR